VRVAFTPNQYETADLLSKMTGTQTIQKATYNFSGKRNAPVMNHINASVENVERPLMTPDEVSRLKPALKRTKGTAERIVAPGHMLIFVSGQHPILGTQMLYFLDPMLKAWSEIPPPAKLVSIQGGQIAPLLETLKVNRSTKKSGRQPEDAERLGFIGSPTVLVDGSDPFATPGAPIGLACRVYVTPEGLAGSPTLDQLMEALR
jgi:type IV secretory pathway TraG/TraD family ATPase VirD4